MANFNLPVRCFLGLAADELVPDHSTLTAFKTWMAENGRLSAFGNLLTEIIRIAREKGIEFGTIQVLDSVHTVANVNVEKDKKQQEKEIPLTTLMPNGA